MTTHVLVFLAALCGANPCQIVQTEVTAHETVFRVTQIYGPAAAWEVKRTCHTKHIGFKRGRICSIKTKQVK